MTRDECLTAALKAVTGQRQQDYGTPDQNFQRVATLWSTILNAPVTPAQVAMCMIALKLARLMNNPTHEDSMIDIAGYAACMVELNNG